MNEESVKINVFLYQPSSSALVISKNLFPDFDIHMISYATAHECCILWNYATLRTQLHYGVQTILSAKDTKAKTLTGSEVFG